MLSHLTFKQIRQLFDPILLLGTGDVTKHESGIVIKHGCYKNINNQSLKHLVSNICESIGKCSSQISYNVQDNCTNDEERLEVTIDCHNGDKIIVIIVCEDHDNKIALWYF